MMVSGLPPEFQMLCSTALRLASVKARWVPSVRVPVPSAAEGSAPPAPFEGECWYSLVDVYLYV